MEEGHARRQGALLFLLLATAIFGFAAILVRLNAWPSSVVACFRLLLAGLALTPLCLGSAVRLLRRRGTAYLLLLLAPGLLLGLHFQLWVAGIRSTTVAAGTFLFSVNPVFFALVERLVYRRRITARTGVSLAMVVAGAGWLFRQAGEGAGPFGPTFSPRSGDLLCFLSMLLFVAYLLASQRACRGVPHLTYIHIIYLGGGLLTLPFALPELGQVRLADTGSLLALLGLAFGPTLVAHSAGNYAVRHFPALTVSFFTLLEPVLATFAAALILGERLKAVEIPSYLLFAAATVLVLLPRRREPAAGDR